MGERGHACHLSPHAARGALLCLLLLPCSAGTPLLAQHVDTVRVGSVALRSVQLPTGTVVVRGYRLAEGIESPLNTTTQTIMRERIADIDVYRIRTTHVSANHDTTVSVTVVEADDFALVHHKVVAARDSAASSATAGHLSGWVVLPNEPPQLIDRVLAHPVFPVEGQIPWLFPQLPFRTGYVAIVLHFSEWAGQEETTRLEVLGSETIEWQGLPVDCWKIDAGPLGPPGYRAVHWIDKRRRLIVRSSLRGDGAGPEYWGVLETADVTSAMGRRQ